MKTLGVDVSHWEGTINWDEAYPSTLFAYYKATDGLSYVDSQFQNNKAGCSKWGIPHAPYHFWQPGVDPITQARHFVRTVGQGYRRYIIDCEERDNMPAHPATVLKDTLDEVQNLTGVKPAIYTSASWWNEIIGNISWAKEYDLLVANYTIRKTPVIPVGWATYKIWQFSENFWMQGCSTNCDGDWFNGTLQEARAWFGNFFEPNPQPPGNGLKMKVISPTLNVRPQPNTNQPPVGMLREGDIIEIGDVAGLNSWVRIKTGQWAGYYCANFYQGFDYLEAL